MSGPLTGEKLPLVCLAGYHRNMSDFAALLTAVNSDPAPRPLVLIDLPGRGRADDRPRAEDYSSVQDARDVADVLAALSIGRMVLLGQSHGGQVAMALAARHPLLIAGTILVDAGPLTDSRGIVRLRNNLAHLEGLKGAKAIQASQRRMLAGDYPGHDEASLDRLALRTHWIDKRGHARPLFDARLIKALDSFNFDDILVAQWPLFDALTCAPLMLLRTQLSDQLRRETFEDMVRRRPDARALTLAGQGSPALFDEREEVDAILAFADGLDGGWRARAA
ncbi:alpha/beta hydrolase [Devosia sp. PTR5]|uniref:Alpha/beta hydrolase n=1 Tax=Devosia oryzisoli TaxID=2774138 RepID=A0A927FTC0_9HYPH|nr:alpha/beta hydrolase [Devosia oryzisoli]